MIAPALAANGGTEAFIHGNEHRCSSGDDPEASESFPSDNVRRVAPNRKEACNCAGNERKRDQEKCQDTRHLRIAYANDVSGWTRSRFHIVEMPSKLVDLLDLHRTWIDGSADGSRLRAVIWSIRLGEG